MPSASGKQHRYMEMIANDKGAAKREGVSQSVAKDFVEADKGKKFPTSKPAARYGKKK